MTRYKDYPIHASAERTNTGAWCAVGVVYAPADVPTTELKRLHTGGVIIFPTENEAEEHGLALCKAWVDDFEQKTNWKDRIEFER